MNYNWLISACVCVWLLLLICVCVRVWLQYGTRHIVEAMRTAGHHIQLVLACGGLSKNPLFVQTHADATGKSPVYTVHKKHRFLRQVSRVHPSQKVQIPQASLLCTLVTKSTDSSGKSPMYTGHKKHWMDC